MRYDPEQDGPYLIYLYLRGMWFFMLFVLACLFVGVHFGLGHSLGKLIAELM